MWVEADWWVWHSSALCRDAMQAHACMHVPRGSSRWTHCDSAGGGACVRERMGRRGTNRQLVGQHKMRALIKSDWRFDFSAKITCYELAHEEGGVNCAPPASDACAPEERRHSYSPVVSTWAPVALITTARTAAESHGPCDDVLKNMLENAKVTVSFFDQVSLPLWCGTSRASLVAGLLNAW